MNVYLHSFGCRLNFSETEIIAGSLQKRGHAITDSPETADLCVINTCTVTERSDIKCRQFIRSLQRGNPLVKIAVVGCYSQMAGDDIAAIDGVNLVLGNQEKLRLAWYVDELAEAVEPIVRVGSIEKTDFTLDYSAQRMRTRAHLKIQDGCDFFCSFCIIPFSRGRSRARVLEDIVCEAQLLGRNGNKELVLTGVNIGTYDQSGHTIVDVIAALERVEGIERIRISSIEPTTVPETLLEMMADPSSKLVPYLHLPLQSANDTVLKDMRRKYVFGEYADFIQKAYETVPDICIGTDVMTGFPTETNAFFEETYRRLADSPIHYFHVFPYSERKGTRSANLTKKLKTADIRKRALRLRELSDLKRVDFYSRYVGKKLAVLFEDKDGQNYWRGYTPNYIRVIGQSADNLHGKVVDCHIHAVSESHAEGLPAVA